MLDGFRLILAFPLLPFLAMPAGVATGATAQRPASDAQQDGPEQEPADVAAAPSEAEDLAAVAALLADPRPDVHEWRVALWEHLARLERAPVTQVLPGWQALAASGQDADRANLILYQRRHALPLASAPAGEAEGPEATLERCLAAWGRSDRERTRALLQGACARFPDDDRFRQNLLWLQWETGTLPAASPDPVKLDADARHLALAVLAARSTRG